MATLPFIFPAPLMSGHFVPALEISALPTWKLLASIGTIPPACSVQSSLVTSLQQPLDRHWDVLSALAGLLGGQEALGKPSLFPPVELCSSFPEWLPDEVMLLADGRRSWRMAASGLFAWATCPRHKMSPFWGLKGKPGPRLHTFIHFPVLS